jgi:GntR family transcriptional regulator
MELKVSRNSTLSIHAQLKEQIKGLVLDGLLEKDEQLPTVRQLGEFLQINKNTVSKVYKDLETEGYVESQKGRGTFVSYKRDKKKTEFLEEIEKVLRKGISEGIDYQEIMGMVYFKSHHLRFLSLKGKINKMAIVECNPTSISDFKDLVRKEVKEVEIEGILIEELKKDFKAVKRRLKDIEFIAIPYVHYHEVDKELEELDKEIFTFGITLSLKVFNHSKKMKNKIVGIIGNDLEEEYVIKRQFQNVKTKEFKFYGGFEKLGVDPLKKFLREVDFLILTDTVENVVKENLKPKKPYIVFMGKYAVDDMRVLREIFD